MDYQRIVQVTELPLELILTLAAQIEESEG